MILRGDEDLMAEQCGAVHPKYPRLTCQRYGGPCPIDDHFGFWEHRYHTEIVRWGEAAERLPGGYRVV